MSVSRHLACVGIGLFCLHSCFSGQTSKKSRSTTPAATRLSAPPVIVPVPRDGFCDFDLYIDNVQAEPDGGRSLVATALYKGQLVSIKVELSNQWTTSPTDKDVPIPVHYGNLTYRSQGNSSGALLALLDKCYGTHLKPTAMVQSTSFKAVALGGDPEHLESGITKIKLFHGSDVEVFTNIDLANRTLGIHEKDPEYRKALIRALTSHP